MDARAERPAPVSIRRENLMRQRPLFASVNFGGESLGGLLSREKVQAAMQMIRPGDTVTLHDEACRWTLSCAAANDVAVRCTRGAASGGALLGLTATLGGGGFAVRSAKLDARTLGALAYMNNQMLPRRGACAAALAALAAGEAAPAAGEAAPAAAPRVGAAARLGLLAGADVHTQARVGIPCLFKSNNSGVVSRVAEELGAPQRCTVRGVARDLYLAGLMCATAPKTDAPMLVVGSHGCAVPVEHALARTIYNEKPLTSHVTVVLSGEQGPERVNCPVRKLSGQSATQLAEALGSLGVCVRGDCFVLSGPMSNNFALVCQQHGSEERLAGEAAVSRVLARAHA